MVLYRNIHEMFMPSLLIYSTESPMPLGIPLWKTKDYPSLDKKYGQE